MGEKVATNEVVGLLLDVCEGDESQVPTELADIIEKILGSRENMSHLESNTVWKFSEQIEKWKWWFLKNISPEKFIATFLDTRALLWLRIIKTVFIRNGYGVTLTGNTVMVYGSNECVKLCVADKELSDMLAASFVDQAELLQSSFQMLLKEEVNPKW